MSFIKTIALFLLSSIIFISCNQSEEGKRNTYLRNNEIDIFSNQTLSGISKERLSRIDTMIHLSIKNHVIPGAVAIVVKDGEVLYHKAWGVSNPETGALYEPDNIFRIASMTKAVASLAVLMLWEEGKFFLDDPIEKYLPEYANMGILDSFDPNDSSFTTIPAEKKITIRHLLTHTSGIGYGDIDGNPSIKAIYWKNGLKDLFAPIFSMAEGSRVIAQQPLHHNPGERFTYSLGIDVIGVFIERISGMSFPQFLRQKIFMPLEMDDTYFDLPDDRHDRLVPVLTKNDGDWNIFHTDIYNVDYPKLEGKTFYSGGAGLSSTVSDYAKFLQVLIQNGKGNGYQLIGKKTCDLIYENQLSGIEEWTMGIATGVLGEKELRQGGKGSLGTLTWGGYFNTSFFADPEEKIVGIIFKQTQNIENDYTSQRFRELVFQSVIK